MYAVDEGKSREEIMEIADWINNGKIEDSTPEVLHEYMDGIEDATIAICGLKLEKGNLVTDWSPAPEDAEDGLEDAMSAAHAAQSAVDGVKNG